MHWLLGAGRLRRLGILGMNRRNAACILDHNPRRAFPFVDDKLRMHRLCSAIGVATPRTIAVVSRHSQLRDLPAMVKDCSELVVKPNRGSAGRGVIVLIGREGEDFRRHNGSVYRISDLRQHVCDILSGMYSLGGRADTAILQQRIHLHPTFDPIAFQGIPDIRVIVFRGELAMAMLRLPTRASGGRANLHQGGIGAGVRLENGLTHHAVQFNRFVTCHPDTKMSIIGVSVPYWSEVREMARRVAASIGLGYLGVDIVVDATSGPMLLEANARPGLAIQIANATGLLPRLKEIETKLGSACRPAGTAPAFSASAA